MVFYLILLHSAAFILAFLLLFIKWFKKFIFSKLFVHLSLYLFWLIPFDGVQIKIDDQSNGVVSCYCQLLQLRTLIFWLSQKKLYSILIFADFAQSFCNCFAFKWYQWRKNQPHPSLNADYKRQENCRNINLCIAKKSSITWWTNRVFKSGVQNFQCNRASHLSDLLHLRCYYMHNNVSGNSWGRVYNQCAFRFSLSLTAYVVRAHKHLSNIGHQCYLLCVHSNHMRSCVYESVCVMVFGWRFQHSVFFRGIL